MNLQAKCKNCNSFIYFRAPVSDRFELARKRGDKLNLKCNTCNADKVYNLNDVKAIESKLMAILALLLFIFGTIGLFIFIWPYFFQTGNIYVITGLISLLTIPFLIYQSITSGDAERIRYFNAKYYG
ncbi:hypothetical protein GCM10011506_38390 [Marivirga lumbricoides]|uniref:CXXC-20-CXXC protein n=1 Tax=Marivirga lumbricoides TaxID=1046115 RepID=A0ABQ1N1A6_9BACT|nr:hypothetical protein GCM10011506_38390 [Marivirga lumbricoides]